MPRSPAKPQQPQVSGTVTDSATASATPRRASFIPIRVDEQVGCSAIAGTFRVNDSRGSTCSDTNATESTIRSAAYRPSDATAVPTSASSICRNPSVQDAASHTIGSSPCRLAAHSDGSTRRAISA